MSASNGTPTGIVQSAKLGNATNEVSVPVPSFPAFNSSDKSEKAQAYDFFLQSVGKFWEDYSFNNLSTFLTTWIPGDSSASLSETRDFGDSMRKGIFDVENLTACGFFRKDAGGKPVTLTELTADPAHRAEGIGFLEVEVSLDPAKYAPEGIPIVNMFKFRDKFRIPLPQTAIDETTGISAARCST